MEAEGQSGTEQAIDWSISPELIAIGVWGTRSILSDLSPRVLARVVATSVIAVDFMVLLSPDKRLTERAGCPTLGQRQQAVRPCVARAAGRNEEACRFLRPSTHRPPPDLRSALEHHSWSSDQAQFGRQTQPLCPEEVGPTRGIWPYNSDVPQLRSSDQAQIGSRRKETKPQLGLNVRRPRLR